MKIVVFLGPSLARKEAAMLCDAIYLPPARMGDVYRVLFEHRPDVIALVDGYFDAVPAVWHKEILHALAQDVQVVGAASMGALRAAELAPFGMIGLGAIYEAFASGELEDDDEVAVAHSVADEDYVNLSVAMVNMRHGLQLACDRGLLTEAQARALIALAKARFYTERNWAQLWEDALARGMALDRINALRRFVETARPDAKREDARALLVLLAAGALVGPARQPALSPSCAPTLFWDRLVTTQWAQVRGSRSAAFTRFVKASEPRLADLDRSALLYHLVDLQLRDASLDPDGTHLGAAIRQFRTEHDLLERTQAQGWMRENRLDVQEFQRLMRLECGVQRLLLVHRSAVDQYLADALARSNILGERLRSFEDSRRRATAPRNQAELETFFRSRVRTISQSLQDHAAALGFRDAGALLDELQGLAVGDEATHHRTHCNDSPS